MAEAERAQDAGLDLKADIEDRECDGRSRRPADGWIHAFAVEWAARRPEPQKVQERSGLSLRK